ncbi:hypothetical protein ACFX1S_029902 [Malus domestica]
MELVAKPSIIFMDELTLGLDARAVSIIMCLLAAFRKKEEVDLCHPLGYQSYKLVEYFEGLQRSKKGYNPTTWMLEVNSAAIDAQNGRKRLTIAEELVAKLSIIFIDELTSGLDARVVSIIMRTEKSRTYQGAKHSITRLQ